MSVFDQIAAARDGEFSGRVMFQAFRNAYYIASVEAANAPDHAARLKYAQRIFKGDDDPKLLAMHVIVASPEIGAAIEAQPASLGKNISDAQLDGALAALWTGRAMAFSAT
jgi:hypothetical protein